MVILEAMVILEEWHCWQIVVDAHQTDHSQEYPRGHLDSSQLWPVRWSGALAVQVQLPVPMEKITSINNCFLSAR